MRSHRAALSPIRAVFEGGIVAGMTDCQLLEQFANGSGEIADVAFSALVDRHGRMVMQVCQSALRDEHDAEDAFQAVFLVLAQKAATLWVHDSLGPWLHGVAIRISARAKADSARRRAYERRRPQTLLTAAEPVELDLIAAVNEEVGRLPDRFRKAVVLCDLEELSHEAAARQLGWPVRTVESRQSRGRERLRSRLERRGLAPTDAMLAMAVYPSPVALPIVRATVCAAALIRAGHGATSGIVSAAAITLGKWTY